MRALVILLATLPAMAFAQTSTIVARQVLQIRAQTLKTGQSTLTSTTLKSTTLKSTTLKSTTLKSTTLKSTTLKPTTLMPLKPATVKKPTTLTSTVQVQRSGTVMTHVPRGGVVKKGVGQGTLVRMSRLSGHTSSSITMLREALLGPSVQPGQPLIVRPRVSRARIRIKGNRRQIRPVEQPIATVFRQLQLQLDLVQMNETLQ